jgi:protein-tyrosine-phosphatase
MVNHVVSGILALAAAGSPPPARPVVFVCEHGNVKSLIAASWFDRLAAERGLPTRAVSRGLTPEAGVPEAIAARLAGDGFDVTGFAPRALASADVEGASRVVLIGAEPPEWLAASAVPVERWDGVPPASERFEASRDALRARIATLLGSLPAPDPAR